MNVARVRSLGVQEYQSIWQQMRSFTNQRTADSADEFWVLQHPAVYTQGQAGKAEHLLNSKDIPVVQSDRGGQITYHGPGQLVVYCLIDLKRLGFGVRDLVTAIESSIINFLDKRSIQAEAQKHAPGVYVRGAKIAALGLRVRKGFSYHGLSLNVDMDLAPFEGINPCGYQGLEVTQLKDQGITMTVDEVGTELLDEIRQAFGYDALDCGTVS